MPDRATPTPPPTPVRVGLDRPDPITIEVDGNPVPTHPGESLATALLAAGYRAVRVTAAGARRAPYCNMGVCFECVVTIDDLPYQRSCLVRTRPGMRVHTGTDR
ncbi:(2Fe-2S)-binding protein [Micromonospora sp. NPDC007271]|uniref:(2Fe-2S)-binding protein n=1 Tax=Micromonospora sp. NPDC007271 TaxID=3154587 RepID=UPI0033BFF97B